MKIKIAFLITGLGTGGAELMLLRLIERLDRNRFSPSVVCMTAPGPVAERLEQAGVPCTALHMNRGLPSPAALWSLARQLRAARPDILHTWMYHADLFGGLAARLAGGIPVIWCVRHGTLDNAMKLRTRAIVHACALLSPVLPSRIVICSEAARRSHENIGYASSAVRVIHNGVDVERFVPSASNRARIRESLGIPFDALLVSHVARFDPQKDHASFIQACGRVLEAVPGTHVLMCGQGVSWDNAAIGGAIRASGLPENQFHLLGRRSDIPALMQATDVVASSSYGESFPNVLTEAMACGVPCAATDVGDSAHIVGDMGRIVPARDRMALASAIIDLLRMDPVTRNALALSARKRVEECFNLRDIVSRYEALYEEVVSQRSRSH